MRIIEKKYFNIYKNLIGNDITQLIIDFDFSESRGEFEYFTKVSAVIPSNIGGNGMK